MSRSVMSATPTTPTANGLRTPSRAALEGWSGAPTSSIHRCCWCSTPTAPSPSHADGALQHPNFFPKGNTVSEMDEVIGEFLVESYENLDQLDRDLLALEDDPDDRLVLGSIFRTIHTVTDTFGFLVLPTPQAITHLGETLLSTRT